MESEKQHIEPLPAAAASPQPCEEDWLILDLVVQSVKKGNDGEYFSEFIGPFAQALRHCCKVGLMRPAPGYEGEIDGDGRVFAAIDLTRHGILPQGSLDSDPPQANS